VQALLLCRSDNVAKAALLKGDWRARFERVLNALVICRLE
jgi:hypothetical protein